MDANRLNQPDDIKSGDIQDYPFLFEHYTRINSLQKDASSIQSAALYATGFFGCNNAHTMVSEVKHSVESADEPRVDDASPTLDNDLNRNHKIKVEQEITKNQEDNPIETNTLVHSELSHEGSSGDETETPVQNPIGKLETGKKPKSPKNKKKKKKNKETAMVSIEPVSKSDVAASFNEWLSQLTPLQESRLLAEKARKKKKKKDKHKKVKASARSSVTKKDNVASETLAMILATQGHYSEAIDMYYILMDMKPSKKDFYNDMIKNLKEKQ